MLKRTAHYLTRFTKRHLVAIVVMTFTTVVFFAPLIARMGSYNQGGDAMFNAWVMARNQHCILRQNCPDYLTANIFYPNKDSMLYSETEVSPGVIGLPFSLMNSNPIFGYNIVTILSFFFAGFAMYILAMYLSRGNIFVSVLAGLLFEFAPIRAFGIFHLQNLSIFCLPLVIVFTLKYLKEPRQRYLVGLFFSALYVFYASWVQLVFVLGFAGIFILGLWVLRLFKFRQLAPVGATIMLAVLLTLPLAKEYIRFSKESGAKFSIKEQIRYSSSLIDYVTPNTATPLGRVYYHFFPNVIVNSYNPDSVSYHGITTYFLGGMCIWFAAYYFYKHRHSGSRGDPGNEYVERFKYVGIFAFLGLASFVVSLGPFLKIRGSYLYFNEIPVAIALPYLAVDKFIPQLAFIRAIGRASVLVLFVLCSLIALLALYLPKIKLYMKYKSAWNVLVVALLFFELMPAGLLPMSSDPHAYNLTVPQVYQYIKKTKDVDNIVIIASDYDYSYQAGLGSFTKSEQTLWSGYHNKNIFNGYSGIAPQNYVRDLEDYNDFYSNDIPKLQKVGIRYVLLDKELCKNHPELIPRVNHLLKTRVYSDIRYDLFKI